MNGPTCPPKSMLENHELAGTWGGPPLGGISACARGLAEGASRLEEGLVPSRGDAGGRGQHVGFLEARATSRECRVGKP